MLALFFPVLSKSNSELIVVPDCKVFLYTWQVSLSLFMNQLPTHFYLLESLSLWDGLGSQNSSFINVTIPRNRCFTIVWANWGIIISAFIIVSSCLLFLSRSPFFIRINLIVFRIFWSFNVYLSSADWFFYTLVIIFLGGIIVMFTYASSLTNVFKTSVVAQFKSTVFLLVAFVFTFMSCLVPIHNPCMSNSTWMVYYWPSTIFTLLIVLTIIITLFVVVKLVQINEGPLKIK